MSCFNKVSFLPSNLISSAFSFPDGKGLPQFMSLKILYLNYNKGYWSNFLHHKSKCETESWQSAKMLDFLGGGGMQETKSFTDECWLSAQ